jgi:hypothetical protein
MKEVEDIRHMMDGLFYREEIMWLQRSHISWMKEGDRNMKSVHQKAATRAKKNNIKRLAADDGQTSRDKKVMQAMSTDFFKGLYMADTGANPGEVVNLYQYIISGEMNTNLCKEFPGKEISDALFHIGPLKEPDPMASQLGFFNGIGRWLKGMCKIIYKVG